MRMTREIALRGIKVKLTNFSLKFMLSGIGINFCSATHSFVKFQNSGYNDLHWFKWEYRRKRWYAKEWKWLVFCAPPLPTPMAGAVLISRGSGPGPPVNVSVITDGRDKSGSTSSFRIETHEIERARARRKYGIWTGREILKNSSLLM